MGVTVRDVARAAGVSASTVSRSLSAPDVVSDETRTRVLAVARELGYRPNRAARGLITGRTGNLGLVVPDLENPFFASVTKGVQSRARATGHAVFVADSDEDAAQEVDLVHNLAKQVDGIVLCSPRASDAEIEDMAAECPLVLVNRRSGGIPSVTVDDSDGVRQTVDHLRALGHRRIAYVAGPRTSWSGRERLAALEVATAVHPDTEVVRLGHFAPNFSGGVAAADLAIASGVTAVLAYNDLVALGVCSRLAKRGVAVPERMSVVGFDDIPLAELAPPGLTTVALPRVGEGRAGVEMLIGLVDGGVRAPRGAGTSVQLPVGLVVRGTTAPPS
ncbi:LacI family DNA-binding transcriptional regulator [Kineococcus sp. NUM-3379]